MDIKVLIKSYFTKQGNKRSTFYRLHTNTEHIPLALASAPFERLLYQFHLKRNDGIYGYKDSEDQTEHELTYAFCKLANIELGTPILSEGDTTTCKYDFLTCLVNVLRQSLSCIQALPDDEFIINMSKDIKDSINSFKYSISDILKDRPKDIINGSINYAFHDFERIKAKYKRISLHRLSLYIEYLLKHDYISPNSLVPALNRPELTARGIIKCDLNDLDSNLLYCPISLDELYPLNLALEGCNFELLKLAIQKKATAFHCPNSTRNHIADLIIFYLQNCKDAADFYYLKKLADSFINDINQIFEIHSSRDSFGVSADFISSEGKDILKEAYVTSLRLNSLILLKSIFTLHRRWLLELLINQDIYSPFHCDNIGTLSDEITKYINDVLKPAINTWIKDHQRDSGIWGYNAITGVPITQGQLGDIDSQRWW